ncbi:ATP-binding protein [Candidatus Phytoplasma pini]|uniref:ATP-binding loader protein for DnaB n=1 Tax=Candidatus Phytoplasma pini TaxID=267362 RepID=A0A559KJJ8_9MOLU|nr:ATP-binding protein [Candidatus Phytoplasma pini]TVY12268.1 ATP-binding loader protein for DnaB [Candidatus Phytoplasma pini]
MIDLSEKKMLEQMREYINQFEETKNLKIDDKDVLVVYNYLQNKSKNNIFCYQMVLKTTPYIHVVLKETLQTKKMYFENDLKSINNLFYQELKLDNFTITKFKNQINNNNQAQTEVLKKSQQIIKSFSKSKKGFYLYGIFHTGKTFLLKALAKELIQQKISVLLLFMPDLTRQFKNNWSYNDNLEYKLNYLKKISCLILDDLGAENMSTFFRDEIFFPFLKYRYENKLLTFFSSNLSLKDLKNRFNSFQDFDSGTKASKIIHTIKQLTDIYEFFR